MEEEIDLREYIKVLIRHWYWIAGLMLVAALVAFVVSSLSPPTYEATAMVIITDPTQRLQGYPSIATSDQVILTVAEATDPPLPPERRGIDQLRKRFNAETADDPSLVKLTVRSQDPEEAARLANAWAGGFVDYLNDVNNLEAQVAKAKTTLEEMDQALAAFRRTYGLGFSNSGELDIAPWAADGNSFGLARRLEVKTDLLLQYEARADQIAQLLGEARMAAAQADDTTSTATMAGLLADMLRLGLVNGESNPMVQINLGGLDARAGLPALITALEVKQNSTDETIARLSAEVETLQSELADRQQELDQLLRDRQVAQNIYLTLSNKLQEARIEAQTGTGGMARLLSRAAVPQEPVSPRPLLNTAIAGVLGLMVGVFAAFFVEYWRQEEVLEKASSDELSPEQASIG